MTLLRLAARVATLSVFLAAILTLAAFGARWHWMCELIVHWRVQITLVAAIACVVLLLNKGWKCALFGGAVALANAFYVAPLFVPQRHDTASGPVWQAVSANVHTSNRNARPFLEFVRSARPDFTLVIEIDDWWRRVLEDLGRDYPHSVVRPRPGRAGIALFSRHPIVSHRVELLNGSREPTLIAKLDLDGQPLNVVGIHPVAPMGRKASELRDQHLGALGRLVARLPQPVIVLGDFNTTSWSPCFQELIDRSGLQDSRLGFGVQPTWPNLPWILRIPIDHALTSRDVVVTQRHVGPDVGSDHFPIVIAFAARPQGRTHTDASLAQRYMSESAAYQTGRHSDTSVNDSRYSDHVSVTVTRDTLARGTHP